MRLLKEHIPRLSSLSQKIFFPFRVFHIGFVAIYFIQCGQGIDIGDPVHKIFLAGELIEEAVNLTFIDFVGVLALRPPQEIGINI